MIEIILTCKVCGIVERWSVDLNAWDDLPEEISDSGWVGEDGAAYCGQCYEQMQRGVL